MDLNEQEDQLRQLPPEQQEKLKSFLLQKEASQDAEIAELEKERLWLEAQKNEAMAENEALLKQLRAYRREYAKRLARVPRAPLTRKKGKRKG